MCTCELLILVKCLPLWKSRYGIEGYYSKKVTSKKLLGEKLNRHTGKKTQTGKSPQR